MKWCLQKTKLFRADSNSVKFQAIQEHAEGLKHLFGPIYDTIRQHKCLLVKEKPDLPKDMKMPIYEFGDVGHKFVGGQILLPEVDKEKNLAGPIYKIDDPTHHFDVIIQSAKAMKELQGMFFNMEYI